MYNKSIYVFESIVSETAKAYANRVLDTGWIGLGKETKKFEMEFADYIGAKYAVGLNSATAGLHLAYLIAGFGKGTNVITTPMTFVSTNLPLLYLDANIYFADVCSDDLNINLDIVDEVIFEIPNVFQGLVLVHYAGNPVSKANILKFQDKHPEITIISDCAHACGASFEDGTKVGSFGKFNIFSFHAVKNLATPDGGMLVTDDEEVYKLAMKLRWCGIDKDTVHRTTSKGYDWEYYVGALGYKYHMNDICAAIGRAHLKELDVANNLRRDIISRYDQELFAGGRILSPVDHKSVTSGHMAVYILPKGIDRDRFLTYMNSNGIHCGVHYYPNNRYINIFDNLNFGTSTVDELFNSLVTLPCHLNMDDKDVSYVIKVINNMPNEVRCKLQ